MKDSVLQESIRNLALNKTEVDDDAPDSTVKTYSASKIEEILAGVIIQSSSIAKADGTLADATAKLNAVITALETAGILAE